MTPSVSYTGFFKNNELKLDTPLEDFFGWKIKISQPQLTQSLLQQLQDVVKKAKKEAALYAAIDIVNALLNVRPSNYQLVETSSTPTVGQSKPDFIMLFSEAGIGAASSKNVMAHMMYGEVKLSLDIDADAAAGQAMYVACVGLEQNPARSSCICMLTDFRNLKFYKAERINDSVQYSVTRVYSFLRKDNYSALSILKSLWAKPPGAFHSTFLLPSSKHWRVLNFLGMGGSSAVLQIKSTSEKGALSKLVKFQSSRDGHFNARREYDIYQELASASTFASKCEVMSLQIVDPKGGNATVECLVLPEVLAPLNADNITITAVVSLIRTLKAAHSRGILHCDLRPPNFLSKSGSEAVLIDWADAVKLPNVPSVTAMNNMSSERVLAQRTATQYSDVDELEALVHVVFSILHPHFVLPGIRDAKSMAVCAEFWSGQMKYPPWKDLIDSARLKDYDMLIDRFTNSCSCLGLKTRSEQITELEKDLQGANLSRSPQPERRSARLKSKSK